MRECVAGPARRQLVPTAWFAGVAHDPAGGDALWSLLILGWCHDTLAIVDHVSLWLLLSVIAFSRVRPWVHTLQLPYLAWTSFATA